MKRTFRIIFLLAIVILLSSCGVRKSKYVNTGSHILTYGKYDLIGYNGKPLSGDDKSVIFTDKVFYFTRDKSNIYEYKIENDEIKYKNVTFFWIYNDNELSIKEDGSLVYRLEGLESTNQEKPVEEKKEDKKTTKNTDNVKIRQRESLELTNYSTSEFSMKIPKGWKVSKGGYGMYFGIRVYDPSDDRNQIFYILKEQPFYKNDNAESYYMASQGYFPGITMGGSPSTEQVFNRFNVFANKALELQKTINALEYKGFDFPYISNFNVIESRLGNSILHNEAVDDKVLRATFNNGSAVNSGEAEGLFSACVVDFGDLGYGNDKFGYYMAYNVSGITSAKDELINNEDILLQSLNSIKFSTSFAQNTVEQINATTQSALSIANQLRQAYQSYNDAWTNRQKSYDIMSQKRSDATLGYERVYDSETGRIYKAYNGFSKDYTGNRYKPISDNQYSEKIYGYIEK